MDHVYAGDVIAGFAPLLRRSLGEDIELIVSCDSPLPVFIDRLQIEQVLLNLCMNARQAMEGRGRVGIESRARQGSPNHAARGERWIEIAVRDNGPGMDEATRRRAFDPFFTTKRDGSGLGLTVSYGIIERHGGSMWIESQPGHGTVVAIHLPVRKGAPTEPVAREPVADTSSAATQILVAEDEPALRRLVCRVLRAKGHEVIETGDGESAVAKVAALGAGLGLVILDVRLPVLSGPAAYERMRTVRPDLPVLFVTGHAPDSEVIRPGSQVLLKPFTHDTLIGAVEEALRRATRD
jgi:CheY-like chemotaxis protein